jgi:hypothetical protein
MSRDDEGPDVLRPTPHELLFEPDDGVPDRRLELAFGGSLHACCVSEGAMNYRRAEPDDAMLGARDISMAVWTIAICTEAGLDFRPSSWKFEPLLMLDGAHGGAIEPHIGRGRRLRFCRQATVRPASCVLDASAGLFDVIQRGPLLKRSRCDACLSIRGNEIETLGR